MHFALAHTSTEIVVVAGAVLVKVVEALIPCRERYPRLSFHAATKSVVILKKFISIALSLGLGLFVADAGISLLGMRSGALKPRWGADASADLS